MFKRGVVLLAICLLVIPSALSAQSKKQQRLAKQAQQEKVLTPEQIAEAEEMKKPFTDTLLFTNAEVALVRESAAGRTAASAALGADKVELIPIDRKIKLSGIYYQAEGHWIVWMNGYKLVPGRLLPEIQEIRVNRDEVFLRWYDIGLNDIISLTLRPNQIYDIVTGIVYNDTAGGAAPVGARR